MNADELALIRAVIDELAGLGEDKPWKSVAVLAGSLEVPAPYLRSLLLDYTRSLPWDELEIRYSQYPSRRSLDLIWAHTKWVGHRRTAALDRYDEEFKTYDPGLEERPCVFVSHSHDDFERALYLREFLISMQLNAWLSEIDILRGADVFEAIAQGLRSCRALLVDLTRNSIDSVWVQKEFMTALREESQGGGREVFVLVDGSDGRLLARLEEDLDPSSVSARRTTRAYPEFVDFLRGYIEDGRPVFALPFSDSTLLDRALQPLGELARRI